MIKWWVLILNLIGWESGASFPDQIWRSKTKAIWDYFRHWIKNCSNTARHQFFFAVLSTHFQSKVSLEHQLPTATQVRKKRTTMKNKNTVIYLCMNLWNCRSALLIYCFFTYILDPEKHRRMHRFFFSVSANCKCQGTTWFVLIPLVVERRQWFGFVSLFFAIRFLCSIDSLAMWSAVVSSTLWPQRVTSIWFLPTISPLNHS